MDGHRMLAEGLWCALAGLYSARQGHWAGSGLPELAPSCISIHLSSPEVPTPRGLLSPMRGIAVGSVWVP